MDVYQKQKDGGFFIGNASKNKKELMQSQVDLVREQLFLYYRQKGNMDYIFKSKKLNRTLSLPTRQIGRCLTVLAKERLIERYNSRFWVTKFNVSKPEIKKSWWKRLLS
jgi:hypothetical protein